MFLPIMFVIFEFHSIKAKTQQAFKKAREEVIFSSDQIEPNETKSFNTTYRHAHGVAIRNAKEVKSNTPADLHIEFEFGEVNVVFSKGDYFSLTTYEGPIAVTKENGSVDTIEFLHSTCGCENFGPSIFYYGSLALGALLIPSGLYLTLKRDSNKSGDGQ